MLRLFVCWFNGRTPYQIEIYINARMRGSEVVQCMKVQRKKFVTNTIPDFIMNPKACAIYVSYVCGCVVVLLQDCIWFQVVYQFVFVFSLCIGVQLVILLRNLKACVIYVSYVCGCIVVWLQDCICFQFVVYQFVFVSSLCIGLLVSLLQIRMLVRYMCRILYWMCW